MRFALLNPVWTFGGSIYFGCREPHLPLEYGYSKALLERTGHEAAIIDGQLGGFGSAELLRRVAAYEPDIIVVTTAPSYLFWRCAPPELRVPQELVRALRQTASAPIVVVGPHASSTPSTTLRKLGADAAIIGECEDILPQLAVPIERWKGLPSLCVWIDGEPHATGLHTRQMLPNCLHSHGPMRPLPHTVTITIASTRLPLVRAQKWKPPAGARIIVRSVQRTTFVTAIESAPLRC
jgi:anaerobic magnesium-protoporphyrin IX monomethyl ester cyclase